MTTASTGNIRDIFIEEEMRSSYLDYAMSVIVARALPDVRDGLKPVHRRILYAMQELGVRPNSAHKKSARIVGEVLGKYHPHGDAPVYDALVRMAQDFSMRYPLVDGQGNFGSVDGDPPAAMRYTEARLSRIAVEMLADIDKETVDFIANFDGSLMEPVVLPARLPNLLVNGSSGIAVGMATSIPPHNLSEVCRAVIHLIDHPDAGLDDVLAIVKGPDFPTAGIIQGVEGIKNAYATGRGRVVVRARADIEDLKGNRSQIVVTELPFQVNKAALVQKIAELARDKKIEGISEVRDESDREGMRVVIELKREAFPEQVLNNLYKHTAMQSAFYINMLALVDGAPRVINLPQTLRYYIDFRKEVVTRRSQYDLRKAKEREHILDGLKIALDHLDQVIATIRKSASVEEARTNLMQQFTLSQLQAQAILDMQLRRLAALERQKILDELAEVKKTIAYLEDLLAHEKKIYGVVKDETIALEKEYGDERLTEIVEEEVGSFRMEDLVPHQNVVVMVSSRGYTKRMPVSTFRSQHRGGRGVTGQQLREMDVIQHLLVADTHDMLLFFTNTGKVFPLKAYQLPAETSRLAKGQPVINLIPALSPTDRVTALVAVKSLEADDRTLLMSTKKGLVKRTPVRSFAKIRAKGLIAMNLRGDELVAARLVRDHETVLLVTERGLAAHILVSTITPHSRSAGGVRGTRLNPGDRLMSMEVARPEAYLLAITKKGYGKLTRVSSYPQHNRGAKGVLTFKVTDKTGPIAAARVVDNEEEVVLMSVKGVVIRNKLREIPERSRITQGVNVMKLGPGDQVACVDCFSSQGPEEALPAAQAEVEEERPEEAQSEAPTPKAEAKSKGHKTARSQQPAKGKKPAKR
ncbi:MAG: DNA gyrase subunit A [Chloroflexi bacterium]|nr:DNA gyrase subunit A [Chloroflexota bacterium]